MTVLKGKETQGSLQEKEAGSLASSSSDAAAPETEREQTEEYGTFQLQDSWKGWIRCIASVGWLSTYVR